MRPFPAWRERWWIWVLPVVFLLANAVFLYLHPGRTGVGFETMQEDLEEERVAARALAEKRLALESTLTVANANREGVRDLYQERFSTQAERLTALLTEVKGLAQRAGFDLPRLSYPEKTIGEFGLVRMGIDFQVHGSYAQFRDLLNLIELSEYFLILEEVALRGSDGADLLINLRLATLFADAPARSGTAESAGAP